MTMPTSEILAERSPWSADVIEVEDGATSEQIIQAAGLDWTVEKTPLLRRPSYIPVTSTNPDTGETITVLAPNVDGSIVEADDVFDMTRVHDGKIYGQVGADYVPVQNGEAFNFGDHLVHDEGGTWIAAGEQYDGKIVFGVMRLDGRTIMVGGEDPIDLFLTIRTSHNGTTGLQAYVTPVRMRCANMTSMMISRAKVKWSMRHVSTLEGKIQQARDTLGLSLRYMDALNVELEKLLDVTMDEDRARRVLTKVIKGSENRQTKVIDGIVSLLDSPFNGYGDTGYGLLNATTDYFDHHAPRRTAAARLQEQYDGEGRKARDGVMQALLTA